METLKLTNITKSYKIKNETSEILKDINLKLYKGEIVSILGESGSGKTTLLNIISGIDSEYLGEIYYDGNILKKENIEQFRKNNVGYIFQNFNLISYLNLIDNVSINLLFSNINYNKRKKMAIKALTSVGLKEHIYKKPNEISGGQKQRVAIARAIINNPKILVCDEPTGSLDSKNTIEILNIFKDLAVTGKTIIIATHSNEVSKICHRIIKIKDGKIEEELILNDFIEYYEEKEHAKQNKKISLISSLYLSIHNTKQKLFRNILVSIGASIGLMGLLIMMSLTSSVKKYINKTISVSKNSNVIDIYKEKQTNSQLLSKSFINEDVVKLKKYNNIKTISYGYSKKDSYSTTINGKTYNYDNINTNSKLMTKNMLLKGNFPRDNEVLLNYYFFKDLDFEVIDKNITIQNKIFKISGIYEDGLSERTIFINYDDINSIYNIKPNIIYIESDNIQKIKTAIINDGFFLSYLEESLNTFNDTFDVVIYILSFCSILSLIISSIMITVVLYISVLERTKEIGLFRALGRNKKEIKKIFISDGILFGIFSGLIGTCFSLLILKLIDYLVNQMFFIKISSINIEYILFVFTISVLISSISSLYPARKASKLNIIDSLRYE